MIFVFQSACHWYKKRFLIFKLSLYSETLFKVLIFSKSFLVKFLGFLMYLIIPSVNRDNLTSTFPFCIPLISFSCLISLAIALNTVLKGSQESGQACRGTDYNGTASTFSLLKMMLAMHLSYMTFSVLKYASSSPTLSKTFITNTFWLSSKVFSEHT